MDSPLGCKASDLEIGTEFSSDGGITWTVVRTVPRYASEAHDCLTLVMMCSPAGTTSLGSWEEVRLEDTDHVLLNRDWK